MITERQELIDYVWDAHKDAYGFRPRSYDFDAMCLEDLRNMANELSEEVARVVEEERLMEQESARQFEKLVSTVILYGAGDRETAIRWIRDAQDEYMRSDDDIRYDYGLPWEYQF